MLIFEIVFVAVVIVAASMISFCLSFKNLQIYSTYSRNTKYVCFVFMLWYNYVDIILYTHIIWWNHCMPVRAQKFNKFFLAAFHLFVAVSLALCLCLRNMYTKTLCEWATKCYKSEVKTRARVKEYHLDMLCVRLLWSGPLANTWPWPLRFAPFSARLSALLLCLR